MKSTKIGEKYIIRIDKGEEIVESLKKFCKENDIKLGIMNGLGATNKIVVGLFETATKQYHTKEFIGDHEICPLYGNITKMNGEPYLHIHVNFCDKNQNSFGGHLSSAIVGATFEIVLEKIDGEIERESSEEIGLNLLKL